MSISPEYVLDKMQFYEMRALLKYEYYAHKDQWETARLVAYTTAQCQTTTKLTLQELIPLYWDEEREQPEKITESDIARLKAKAQKYTELLNKNG